MQHKISKTNKNTTIDKLIMQVCFACLFNRKLVWRCFERQTVISDVLDGNQVPIMCIGDYRELLTVKTVNM